jgi:histidine kinase
VSQKLYGRETELKILEESFQRVVSGSSTFEVVIVKGFSGIGKTSLINHLLEKITLAKGEFASGKFDQFHHDVPYQAFLQALESLISFTLSREHNEVERIRQEILTAVGENGQVVLDIIPSAEALLGKQPPVLVLPPTETQQRLLNTLTLFISAFCKHKPLILFLDGIQISHVLHHLNLFIPTKF